MGPAQRNGHLPPQLRRVHALLAGGAADRGGLVTDVDDLEMFGRIVDAWDDELTPMTRAQVAEVAGLDGDPDFDSRFDLLVHYGAVVSHRRKAHTIRYTPDTLALVSAKILADLESQSAADQLADLIILALDRIDADDVTADELAHIASRLARTINAVTATINRAVDLGTAADLVEAHPSKRAQRQVERVADLVARVRGQFDQMTHRMQDVAEAAGRFASANDRLVERLSAEVTVSGAAGLLALLAPDDVTGVCRTADVAALSGFASGQLFDAPQPVVTHQGLIDAAAEIGAPPPVRTPPPVPDTSTATDPVDLLDEHTARVARQDQARRRWATSLLADSDEAVVTDDVWPAPLQRLVDALALTDDPTVPVAADLNQRGNLDPDGHVASAHPLRLRRLDRTGDGQDAVVTDRQEVDR